MEQTWLDEFEDKNMSLDDIERSVRYAKDLTAGLTELRKFPRGVTVFGSARTTETDPYYIKARELGAALAHAGETVITGGGNGIMEAANRGAFEAGGRSIGLNIKLPREQTLNKYTTDNLEFYYFFARKVMLVFAAKVYVYFPGGFGTLDEFSEVLTLMQTHKMARAPIFLYGTEFWSGFDQFVASTLETKFQTISAGDRELYKITDDIQEIVAAAVAETRSIEEAIQIAANAPDAKRDGRVI